MGHQFSKFKSDLRRKEALSFSDSTYIFQDLIAERLLSASSVNVAVNAVRFLYAVTLGRETLDLMASVSDMKRATGFVLNVAIRGTLSRLTLRTHNEWSGQIHGLGQPFFLAQFNQPIALHLG